MITKETTLTVTVGQIQAAFTEWDRRYREDPESFVSEAYHLLFTTEEDYGADATPYFLSVLDDLKVSDNIEGESGEFEIGDAVVFHTITSGTGDEFADITIGKPYKITFISFDGTPVFIDDAGDEDFALGWLADGCFSYARIPK